ncbi:MAG: copper amine oxidase N-terminal domain-containing protein [Mycobacterium leprae]
MHRLRFVTALFLTLALMLSMAPRVAAEDLRVEDLPRVSVVIDGRTLQADAFIVNGRTVVPLRAIFEALSATVEWDAATRTVTGMKGNRVIKLTIDQTEAYVDGKPTTLSVPAMIINGRTFVPLRFIGESLGIPTEQITFDGSTRTVNIVTGSGCTLVGGQQHEGTIRAGGETWGLCGSPHIVSGDFMVEGKDSPVLTIEAGVLVQFENGASIQVGKNAPGGLLIKGTASNPTTLDAAIAGAQPGSWNGIQFYDQTMKGSASIEGARIKYAGGTGSFNGAIYLEGNARLVEVLVKDTTIENSQFAGINLFGQARLAAGSKNLTITGTKSYENDGGFPIITGIFGSNNLPDGKYTGNEFNAVHLWTNGGWEDVPQNTTWRNIGIPYASSVTVKVGGNSSPTLKLEPGVISLWKDGTALEIGREGPGTLIADAKTKPEGGGDWTIDRTALDTGLNLAGSTVMTGPTCSLCGSNHAIVFGAWSDQGARGGWNGIHFYSKAGDKSKMIGVVVANAGKDGSFNGAVYLEAENSPVRLQIANSMISGSAGQGLELFGNNASLMPGSTGNVFTNNVTPVRMFPEAIGSFEAGNTIAGNDNDWVSVWANGGWEYVTKSATWRNQGVPYYFETSAYIGGTARPTVTIEPGTKLMFAQDMGIKVGNEETGSLVAVGTAAKPITFTSEITRAGTWNGIEFFAKAGNGNKIEYATIEYATNAVSLYTDLGAFVKNTTIRSSAQNGIYREYDLSTGTSFTKGLGNQFEGNAVDENVE